jgi:hypothetical protein
MNEIPDHLAFINDEISGRHTPNPGLLHDPASQIGSILLKKYFKKAC